MGLRSVGACFISARVASWSEAVRRVFRRKAPSGYIKTASPRFGIRSQRALQMRRLPTIVALSLTLDCTGAVSVAAACLLSFLRHDLDRHGARRARQRCNERRRDAVRAGLLRSVAWAAEPADSNGPSLLFRRRPVWAIAQRRTSSLFGARIANRFRRCGTPRGRGWPSAMLPVSQAGSHRG